MSETEKNEPEAAEDANWHLRVCGLDRTLVLGCGECRTARALIAAHEREAAKDAKIAELRAALGEACDLAGYGLQSTTDAGRLDTWRKLAEGGK